MAKVTGVLYKVFEKAWQGKTLRSFKLDGNPLYYRWGEKPVPANVVPGATLTFEAEQKDDKSATIKGDIVVSEVKARQATEAPVGASGGTVGGTNWAAKDDSIRYQSSRKDALAFYAIPGALAAAGFDKAKPADKMGVLEALIDKKTAEYFEDVATFGAVARASGAGKTADEPTPGADEDEE